jgi:hypothetical protein
MWIKACCEQSPYRRQPVSPVQCSAVQCSAVQCSAVQCSAVLLAIESMQAAAVVASLLCTYAEQPGVARPRIHSREGTPGRQGGFLGGRISRRYFLEGFLGAA